MNAGGGPAGSCLHSPSSPQKGRPGGGASDTPASSSARSSWFGDLRLNAADSKGQRSEKKASPLGVCRTLIGHLCLDPETRAQPSTTPLRQEEAQSFLFLSGWVLSLFPHRVLASLGTSPHLTHIATGWHCWMILEFQEKSRQAKIGLGVWTGRRTGF